MKLRYLAFFFISFCFGIKDSFDIPVIYET